MRWCSCAEGRIHELNGTDTMIGLNVHNCYYIDWRNSLIPLAEKYADSQHNGDRHTGNGWGITFHREMNRLVKERAGDL